jgi:hypothetical protein
MVNLHKNMYIMIDRYVKFMFKYCIVRGQRYEEDFDSIVRVGAHCGFASGRHAEHMVERKVKPTDQRGI